MKLPKAQKGELISGVLLSVVLLAALSLVFGVPRVSSDGRCPCESCDCADKTCPVGCPSAE